MNQGLNRVFNCEYATTLNQFLNNVDSILLFVNSIKPIFQEKYDESDVSKSKLLQLIGIIKELDDDNEEIKEKLGEDLTEKTLHMKELLEEKCDLEFDKDKGTISFSSKNSVGMQLREELLQVNTTIKQFKILYESSFINCVIFFELFISKLISLRLKKYPSACNLYEKPITLKDIERHSSVEQLKEVLVEEEVQDIMRGKL